MPRGGCFARRRRLHPRGQGEDSRPRPGPRDAARSPPASVPRSRRQSFRWPHTPASRATTRNSSRVGRPRSGSGSRQYGLRYRSSAKSCLTEDARHRLRVQVVRQFAGHRDPPGLDVVLELPVATADRDDRPAIVPQQPQSLADLHLRIQVKNRTARLAAEPRTVLLLSPIPSGCLGTLRSTRRLLGPRPAQVRRSRNAGEDEAETVATVSGRHWKRCQVLRSHTSPTLPEAAD